jgi:ribosomal protein L11 methyltransferase
MSHETKRTWRVVELEIDRRHEEMAGWLMMQLGANGCQVESPPPGADAPARLRLQATFELDALPEGDLSRISAALDEYGLNASISSLRTKELLEEDWLSKWKEGFEPFPIGDRLLICPPWHRDKLTTDQLSGRKVVLIEPGLAFGTGFHETTRFCLLALQDYVDHAINVLDIGSGSGILAISVALLNDHAKIIGLETDPVACKNAGENLALNQLGNRIELFEGSTSKLIGTTGGTSSTYDLILANLTYEDHVALIGDYVKLLAPGAHILFAGILKEKGDLMASLLAKHGLQQVRRDDGEKWTGFVARAGLLS